MSFNHPIFSDLSTYTPKETINFYENIFGWKFYNDDSYYVAYKNDKEIVGLYETPEKFQKMQMPHFWMTYFRVENVDRCVDLAKEKAGIIEVTQDMSPFGKIALIRDPQGAGFTIYEGDKLKNSRTINEHNTLIWNELHVSNSEKVIPFYEALFKWNIKKESQGYFKVYHNEEHIVDILEIDNTIKGKYEYWVNTFGVESLQKTKYRILEHGGAVILEENQRTLFTDHSHQAFFYVREI